MVWLGFWTQELWITNCASKVALRVPEHTYARDLDFDTSFFCSVVTTTMSDRSKDMRICLLRNHRRAKEDMLRASCRFAKRQDSCWWWRMLLEASRNDYVWTAIKLVDGSEGDC
jgi:hypothetical protein